MRSSLTYRPLYLPYCMRLIGSEGKICCLSKKRLMLHELLLTLIFIFLFFLLQTIPEKASTVNAQFRPLKCTKKVLPFL